MKKNNEHKTQLGYNVPENYFERSKAEHLAFLKRKNTTKSPKKNISTSTDIYGLHRWLIIRYLVL